MSQQQNEYLIPTKTQYSVIEPAFMSCSVGGDNLTCFVSWISLLI